MSRLVTDFWADRRVLITGSSGFLGTHLLNALTRRGADVIEMSGDLRDRQQWPYDHMLVFHLAARVGGIAFNQKHPADIIYNNVLVDTNVLYEAALTEAQKVICVGSVCAYPRYGPTPMLESDFWNGEPEPTNAAYAHAKRLLLAQLQAYHWQHGMSFAYLVLANLYGPGQTDHPENSHVIPALVGKIKDKTTDAINVWGTGSAVRDFLWVDDAVDALIKAAERPTRPEPINVGSGQAVSIASLATMLKTLASDPRPIAFEPRRPDGQAERLLDITRAKEVLGWQPSTTLEQGLRKLLCV